jgi:acyl-[acyl-carrier-protein]-phospholipid O-acyltransferase/long-chain-fatty-acid--[acyl-carrier-protein] ligase
MVSLTAVEEALSSIWKNFQYAVVAIADEKKGEQLVLFTTRQNTTVSEISTNFKKLGFSDLFVPRKIEILEEMLLMGNGKTDYVTLKSMAEKLFI